ncbi:hypothetical protein CA983_15095 [Streptomyces swartbergensis]|uniref:Thiolase N-terminal domain-containing protein n=1 Tax=Streptomyces swartbergensis TaxID=487165 RepID=A0A243S4E2_9ACTN|nr:hypothetical protein CA983_15095 [Streptomyces swartbergensis]
MPGRSDGGTVTAGNASPLNDSAAALLVDEEGSALVLERQAIRATAACLWLVAPARRSRTSTTAPRPFGARSRGTFQGTP